MVNAAPAVQAEALPYIRTLFLFSIVLYFRPYELIPALSSFLQMAFFFGISQGVLATYIPQLFPTVIRAFATGFCYNIGRLFTASVVFFIGALVDFLGGYGNAIFIFSFISNFKYFFIYLTDDSNK